MKQIKTILIKCDCKDTLNYKDLTEFQGELKARTEEDIAKAKTSILKYGMSFPFFVYKKGTKNYILDGHARKRVFAELEAEGYLIPELPVVYVECKNEKDAKQEMDNVKMWLHSGAISYEQAQRMAKPHIDAMNEKSKEIAKRCGVKPKYISFSAFMR